MQLISIRRCCELNHKQLISSVQLLLVMTCINTHKRELNGKMPIRHDFDNTCIYGLSYLKRGMLFVFPLTNLTKKKIFKFQIFRINALMF